MRPLLLLLTLPVLIAVTACDGGSAAAGTDLNLIVAVGDTLRDVRVHIPDGIALGQPARLLVALHDSGDSGASFQNGSRLDDKAPDDMIVAYPSAAVGNWAEGCQCNIADRLEIDDLGFMSSLIDSIGAWYSVSRAGTYALGFSQGGLFAYRLACEMTDQFASVIAISAPMSEPLSQNCSPARAVSMLTIHGSSDSVLPWDGTDQGALSLLSAAETVVFWSQANECAPSERGILASGDATLQTTLYDSCRDGTRVGLFEIRNGQHAWYTSSPDVRTVALDFLES
ncbi:MAG: polyhydroxybutyrate depolymerase [Rhodothermales bacterium]|jgi:polyhydroxybutyrate depolymerase